MNSIPTAIEKLVKKRDFDPHEAQESMRQIMSGRATPAQIGAFLTALRIKGETPTEIASFARTMRSFAHTIQPEVDDTLVDTCGTGGDEINTFNISTSAMFVAAGAGVPIAKHGNCSVTSKSGSADILEALGVDIDSPPEKVEKTVEEIGVGFMFAPNFHKAMKHAIAPRKEIEMRTVFNVLGPLTNPAGAKAQVMGVYEPNLTEKMAKVLKKLDCRKAMVVHGLDGLDEISTLGKTKISQLSNDKIQTYTVEPEKFDIPQTQPEEIAGGNPRENAKTLLKVLKGEEGPKTDIVSLNAGAAIFVGGKAASLEEGIKIAGRVLSSGEGYDKLVQLVEISGEDKSRLRELEDST
ncbi:anthranilate phosphoribosyltransferase [candidate division MSBL1 archaeon SCGC-AAA259I07]|uniref:Anthranilate phosphoribosyltransferase n=1 Tax=candidate division MSBL1 archaeon SCGC-AAA259I07 TaxID=1698266 RepID=A0A133UKH3_9EURY|nr:anthranilate phosphoribosyltransferase [candidate division MSBL1 archaeon SCGC-AAA259I07]